MARNIDDAYKKLEQLKSDRGNWESLWQDCTDYNLPNKNDITTINTPGRKRNLQIFDSTGVNMNKLLAGALHGMLTNPTSDFFELYTGIDSVDRDDASRKWLQKSGRQMLDGMNNSNFQTEIHEVYLDLGCIGTSIMSIEDDPINIIRFLTHPIAKTFIQENNYGMVDTVYRCYEWKPEEILKFLGEDKAPAWLKKVVSSGQDKKIEILNLVEPRENYSNKAIDPRMFRFSSCWYLKDVTSSNNQSKEPVKESGFRTMPYVTPRWAKGTGEMYGRSPAMDCLPEVKMLNKMMEVVIKASEKAMDPPLLIPDDSVIGTVKTYPGGMNFYRGNGQDFIRPLETGGNIAIGVEMIEQTRKAVREAYYINQLQLQEGPQKTATEVMQISDESRRFLGPLVGRQNSELLQPMLERVYDIYSRRRIFDALPDAMVQARAPIRVKYRSTLAKAQLAGELMNIQRAVQGAAPFMQLDPEARHVIDAFEGVRYAAQLSGLPQELIRDKKALEEIMQRQAAAAQEAAEAAQVQSGSEVIKNVTPALQAAQSK